MARTHRKTDCSTKLHWAGNIARHTRLTLEDGGILKVTGCNDLPFEEDIHGDHIEKLREEKISTAPDRNGFLFGRKHPSTIEFDDYHSGTIETARDLAIGYLALGYKGNLLARRIGSRNMTESREGLELVHSYHATHRRNLYPDKTRLRNAIALSYRDNQQGIDFVSPIAERIESLGIKRVA